MEFPFTDGRSCEKMTRGTFFIAQERGRTPENPKKASLTEMRNWRAALSMSRNWKLEDKGSDFSVEMFSHFFSKRITSHHDRMNAITEREKFVRHFFTIRGKK